MNRTRHPQNASGPFYVEEGCCTMCGVPETYAPEMFGADARPHCFVKSQPVSEVAIDRAIRVMWMSELGCVRYGGSDPRIIGRLAELGEASLCDEPAPPGAAPRRRDHAAIATTDANLRALTADQLGALLTSHLQAKPESPYRFRPGHCSTSVCDICISWFEDVFHLIRISVSDRDDVRWLIHHAGPVGLSFAIHDWLAGEGDWSVRWLTEAEWAKNEPGRRLPW